MHAQSRARRHKRSGGTARQRQRFLEKVHLNAAGIDIGSTAHWVAVPEDRATSGRFGASRV